MWSEKDALIAVMRYFRSGESCILIQKPHRFLGIARSELVWLLIYVAVMILFCCFLQIITAFYWFLLIVISVIVWKKIAHHVICKNYIILTEFAVYRYIRSIEPKIMQSEWSDVICVTVKRSRFAPSYATVSILCQKDRLPKRFTLPKKLFRLRFGKIDLSKVYIDTSHLRPIKQTFAVEATEEFMQIIREIRSMPQHSFVIRTRGI